MKPTAFHDISRALLALSGPDTDDFLQGLITNDVKALSAGPLYAAILSPQGKYLFDFIAQRSGDAILLDIAGDQAAALLSRLNMYKLRAKVEVVPSALVVMRGGGEAPAGAFADPRSPLLGWRAYVAANDSPALPAGYFDAARVEAVVPETGIELLSNDSYILEMGFERLNGVNFRKGCYVGQEVTARMQHKTELRKGLVRVQIGGVVPIGSDLTRDGRRIGQVYTQANGKALAYLRHDLAGLDMQAAGVSVALDT